MVVIAPLGNADLLCLLCAYGPLGVSRMLLSSRAHERMLPVLCDALDGEAMYSALHRAMAKTMTGRISVRHQHLQMFPYHSDWWSYEQLNPYLASAIAGGADADLIYGLLCTQRSQQARQQYEATQQAAVECDGEGSSCDSDDSEFGVGSAVMGQFGTPLYAACKCDDLIVSLLLSFGDCGHAVNGVQFVHKFRIRDRRWLERRETPLFLAAKYGRESTVRLLLQHRADPMENSRGLRGCGCERSGTALYLAARARQSGVVKALLEHGACPSSICRTAGRCAWCDPDGSVAVGPEQKFIRQSAWQLGDYEVRLVVLHALMSCERRCRCPRCGGASPEH